MGDWWAGFRHDPRERTHAHLRASDHDRERVTGLLTTAYADGRIERDELDERMAAVAAARTLGEIPALVVDLEPLRPVARPSRSLVGVPPEQLRDRAVEKWSDQRRGAVYVAVGTAVLGWGVLLASGLDNGWLLVLHALALLHLGRVLLAREQIVRDELRRLEKRQAGQELREELRQELRHRLPRALPWQQ